MSVFALVSVVGLVILSVGFSPKAKYPLMVTQYQKNTSLKPQDNENDVKKTHDKMKEYVITGQSPSEKENQHFPMDINAADRDALMQVDGIGKKKADSILSYIRQHGPIQKMEQLTEVEGIGEVTLKKICEKFYIKN